MIRILRGLGLCGLLALSVATGSPAQSGSLYVGFGTATDSSIGTVNTLNGGVVYNAPSLDGLFDTVGGDVIFFRNLGLGAEYTFRNSRGPYAGLQYHPVFYDVNAVYQPLGSSRRFAPELQGGIGRAAFRFYYTPQFCNSYPLGCRSNTAQATETNHLEVHFAGGVRYYVYKDVFVRPQVDARWVRDLSYFSNSWIPEFTVAVGYTFRRKK